MKKRTSAYIIRWAVIAIVSVIAAIYQSVLPQIKQNVDSVTVSRPSGIEIPQRVVSEGFVVRRVVDGDTLVLDNGEHVRLIGIDSPESRMNQRAQMISERTNQDIQTILKMGNQSKVFLKDLIEGKEVILEYDVGQKDRYGRTLAYVFYPLSDENSKDIKSLAPRLSIVDREDGKYVFLNATILRSGYATPLKVKPNVKYAKLFDELYQEAQENQSGLWVKNSIQKEDRGLVYQPGQ